MYNKIEKIKNLTEELLYHCHLYYNLDSPEITDFQYDKKYQELEELENEANFWLTNSPTRKVQGQVLDGFQKVTHSKPMLSAAKTKDINEIKKFIGNNNFYCSYKLDGLTLITIYEGGEFKKAITRGTGLVGEDVTEQAKWSVLAFAHMGTTNWSPINALFTAFWAGNKLESFTQTDTFGLYDYSGITITNDFSLVGARKIAFLMGDIHRDKVWGGNYPLVSFLDCKYETVKLGTPNEAALSVLIATPSEGTITELRFGEGTKTVDGAEVPHDPLTDYDNYRVIDY